MVKGEENKGVKIKLLCFCSVSPTRRQACARPRSLTPFFSISLAPRVCFSHLSLPHSVLVTNPVCKAFAPRTKIGGGILNSPPPTRSMPKHFNV